MAYTEITIHGYLFTIDTMDWNDSADAERCAGAIAAEINKWAESEAALYHGLMVQCQNDEIDYDHGPLTKARQMCSDCASEILDGYGKSEITGHNYSIAAA